jgi:hypothetical protein
MGNPWFRHYVGTVRDKKFVSIAIKLNQPVERVAWVWMAVLESCSERNDGGHFEADAGEIARFLVCKPEDIASILAAFEEPRETPAGPKPGMIEAGIVSNWATRQYLSSESVERVRRHRERKRQEKAAGLPRPYIKSALPGNGNVALHPRYSNGHDVTPETDTDTEAESEILANGAAPPKNGALAPMPRAVPSLPIKPGQALAHQELFRSGVEKLAALTGRGPSACRSIISDLLTSVNIDHSKVLKSINKAVEAKPDPSMVVAWLRTDLRVSE